MMNAKMNAEMFTIYYLHTLIDITKIRETIGRENTSRLTNWAAHHLASESSTSGRWHPTVSLLRLRHKAKLIAIIMKSVNVLMVERKANKEFDEWVIREMLGNLLGHVYILTEKETNREQYHHADQIIKQFRHASDKELFGSLMAMIG